MKLTKTIALSCLAFSMMAAQAAQAGEPFINPDWANSAVYIGAGIGQSRASIDEQRIRASLTANGATVNAFTTDEREAGYKLFVGKQLGIFGSVWLTVKAGLAQRPRDASWTQVYGVALLCGIGFTMSLFIGGLAFTDPALSDAVKIGVLMGSIASALAGFTLLRFASKPNR